MKRIEDIEKMSIAELQEEASRLEVNVPEGLEAGIRRRIGRYREHRAGLVRNVAAACVCALLAFSALIGIGLSGRMAAEPQDTFTDPLMAYAEVERAFGLLSEAMSNGASEAVQGEIILTKQKETIEKLMK